MRRGSLGVFVVLPGVSLVHSAYVLKLPSNGGRFSFRQRGHPMLVLSRGKTKYFFFCKNNKLQNLSHFGNTPALEFFYKFTFSSTNLSPITNSESKRYHYPVCHTPVATHHPLSRFQSSARGPGLSPTRSITAST